MKNNLSIGLVVVLLLLGICSVDAQNDHKEFTYTYSNGKRIIWDNELPDSIKKITKIENFADIINSNKEQPLNIYLRTWISENSMYILVNIPDDDFYKKDSLCFGDKLSLVYPFIYMRYANIWFFNDMNLLPKAIQESLHSLHYIYLFQFDHNDIIIQATGRVLRDEGFADIVLSSQLLVCKKGSKEYKLFGENGIEGEGWASFITLGGPYNFITKEYYPSYLVYKAFERNDALEGIPDLY